MPTPEPELLWREPIVCDSDPDDGDEPELPDILVRLRKQSGSQVPYRDASVRGPATLREVLALNCYVRTGGVVAREFQLDVGEAVQQRRDMIVQAFTGAGKSLAMIIFLFTFPKKFVLIASPLNNLEENMVRTRSPACALSLNSTVRRVPEVGPDFLRL